MIRLIHENTDDAAYEAFVQDCQKSSAYKQIVKICNKYGYNNISDTIYIDKSGKIKYFNVDSDDRTLPRIHFNEAEQIHTIDTSGFGNMTNDEFKDLISNYQKVAKMVDELSKVDLNKLYSLK